MNGRRVIYRGNDGCPSWRYKRSVEAGFGCAVRARERQGTEIAAAKSHRDEDEGRRRRRRRRLRMLATSTAGDAVAVGGDAGLLVCSVLMSAEREDARASDGGDNGLISNSTKAPPAAARIMISKNK